MNQEGFRCIKKLGIIIFVIFLLAFFSFCVSALIVNTSSYSINSTHLGSSGNNFSTSSYNGRDTITFQQAGTKNVLTSTYSANSGWFEVVSSVSREAKINEVFFSNESEFNYSNTFNSSEITYGMNLTYIGANCTSSGGAITNVTFNLFNVEDNVTYINTTGYNFKQGDLYVLNSSYVLRDSGNWSLNISCYIRDDSIKKNQTIWELAWGTLQIILLSPVVDTAVQIYEFFTFSANVTCIDGECGTVNVTLDPEDKSEKDKNKSKDKEGDEPEENEIDTLSNETFVSVSPKGKAKGRTKFEEEPENASLSVDPLQTEEFEGETFEEGEILEIEDGKDVGKKLEDELDYETYFIEMEYSSSEFKTIFYHTFNETLPIYILGDVNYTLNKNESDAFENVNLRVDLVEGILPKFELHIGENSEVFSFGKTIPKIKLKQGKYFFVDRDDFKLDVGVDFDSKESIILRGLENETEISVILGTNFQEDISSSIVAVPSLNIENATIVLEKNSFVNSIIQCGDSDFDYETLECFEWKYVDVNFTETNETIEFEVEHFTAYAGGNLSAEETATLTIWDENDIGMPLAVNNTTSIKVVNENVTFFTEYKLARNATKISDGNCTIDLNDTLSNMTYDSNSGYYNHTFNFSSTGIFSYEINCTHPIYTNLSASDQIAITLNQSAYKGAISTTIGDVPFYTTSDNPQECELKGGESCELSWEVNATGVLDKIYDFFVIAFGFIISPELRTVSEEVNSSHLNIQITANDTISPIFNSVSNSPSVIKNGSITLINANIEDNVQVDSVWGTITHPSGFNSSFDSVPYNFSNTTELGIYDIFYYSNDTSGNNATTTNWFEVGEEINTTINISLNQSSEFGDVSDFMFRLVYPNFSEIIYDLETNESFNLSIPDVIYDVEFLFVFNQTLNITFRGVNLSLNENNSFNFDKHKEILGYLAIYGIDTTYTFNFAEIIFGYNESESSNEENLKLYKCDNYNFAGRVCDGSWVLVSENPNISENIFAHNTTNFSGFGIYQFVSPVISGDVVAPSGGSARGCGTGYVLQNDVCVLIETPVEITEELLDISWTLEDSLISNSDELTGVVSLESFGNVPTEVDLTFIIFDELNNELYRDSGNVLVLIERVVRWEYESLDELPEGNYSSILQTIYGDNIFDEFTQRFEIIKPKKFDASFLAIIIFVGVCLSVLIWLLFRFHKKLFLVLRKFKWKKVSFGFVKKKFKKIISLVKGLVPRKNPYFESRKDYLIDYKDFVPEEEQKSLTQRDSKLNNGKNESDLF